MTPKEAIEILMSDEKLAEIEYYGGFEGQKKVSKLYSEAFDIAIEALEKQVPKKPLNVQDCYIPETYDYDYSVANCPNCRGAFSFDEYHRPLYCDKCGQKLSFEGLE